MGRFPETTVESPWDGPEPVLHIARGGGAEKQFNRKLGKQVRNRANTHVVREVRAGYVRDYLIKTEAGEKVNAYTRTFLEDCIGRAEGQFKQLETYGIAIPDHEFAIAPDNLGRDRVLARIAIIDGKSCGPRSFSAVSELACKAGIGFAPASVQQELYNSLCEYRDDVNPYERLADIAPVPSQALNDFVYGAPRGALASEQVSPCVTLVDLEPLFTSPHP